jgi:hypothetical protein
MKVLKRPVRKRSRGATRPDRREDDTRTADLLPAIDWVRPAKRTPKLKPAAKKPRRGRKAR